MSSGESMAVVPTEATEPKPESKPEPKPKPEAEPPDPEVTQPLPLEAQVEQAIAQLALEDFHSQWDHAKQFSRQFSRWGDRVIPLLIHQLQTQPDPDTQWFLVRILSQFEHPDIVTVLARLLVTTPSEELQREVRKALSSLGESAIETLSKLLVASDEEAPLGAQRMLAARTLAHIRRSAVIEPLLGITEDPDPALRAIATEALGSFHDPRITPVLLAALQDEPAICIEAIRTLGRRRDLLATTDLVTPLQRCLIASDEAVACECAIALGRLGSEAAVAALGQQLVQPLPTAVKVSIVRSLGWLNVASSVQYLAQSFDATVPVIMPAVKKEIAQALGQTREVELQAIAATPLIEWLKTSQTAEQKGEFAPDSDSFALLQTILSALARLGVTEAIDSLIPILSTADPRIRMHALSALKQIDPRTAQSQVQGYLHQSALSPVKKQYVAETLAAW